MGGRVITKDAKNILVADDSIFFRTRLSDVLTEAGHRVSFAKDGREVIEGLKAAPKRVDLIILDLQMPDVDGFGVMKWINENGLRGALGILAVTGAYEPTEVIERLKGLGADGFMSKALPPEQIIFRVNRLLFSEKAAGKARSERVPVSIPVDFTFRETPCTGVIINMSEGGIFLYTDVDLPVGGMLNLKFSLPGIGRLLNVKGTVRWAPYEFNGKVIFCGYGVMFASMPQDDEEAIKDFVSNEMSKIERKMEGLT